MTAPPVSPPPSGVVEALAEGRLDERGVGLAARRLHDLADEEADRLRLAGPVVGDRGRVGGEHGVDGRAERARVRDLAEARAPRRSPAAARPVAACSSRTSLAFVPRELARDDAPHESRRARPRRPTSPAAPRRPIFAQPQVLAGDPVRDLLGGAGAGAGGEGRLEQPPSRPGRRRGPPRRTRDRPSASR